MSAAVPPQGIITFLFTDIEGSTRRWEADADAMRAALHAHDGVLRNAVAAQNGWLFKHTGDGVCAAFTSPSAAVDTAVAAQRIIELPVRMALATGEAELRDGDYFGPVLNRAARIMGVAHGCQILLDGITADLISGVDLLDLGPRRLRDIAKPVEVFQVQSDGLPTEFPPLKTLDPMPGNLRAQTTSFIGRQTELTEVLAALKTHRLVTLTGVGGVGKTRLAVEAASRLAHTFPDGAWMIELAAVGDPGAVPEAVAAVLGITQQPGMSVADTVAAALEGRSRLLVMDNCEHVLDAAGALIEAIFAQSATVKVLATSREGLRVADEQLWPVPSLDMHSGIDSSAATLFIERAASVAPDISLAGEDAATAVEICRRLDGIPLAIELAASRLLSMSVIEVRDHLDDRFRLLVGSRRGLERHQTLHHAVQWSYDLLTSAEKSLFASCSVFVGGFELAGALAVDNGIDEFATLDLLDALVRKSLLMADRSTGRTRFSMLETIRQFAEDQLVASGRADEARSAHSRYFAGRESDVLALWDSPRQRSAYSWFLIEVPNLRTAFRWAADREDLDTAAALAIYGTFIGNWVELHEPVAWCEELLEPAKAIEHRRLAQLYVMAAQCFATGRIDDAISYGDAGLSCIESGRFDDVPDEFAASLGGAYISTGQPQRYVELCRNMLMRDPTAYTYGRACLALALTVSGAVDEARAASEDLVVAARATDNPQVACYALMAYGLANHHTEPKAAYEALRRGMTIAQDSGNRQIQSILAIDLSRLAVSHGDPSDALDYLRLSIRNYHDSGTFYLLRSPLAILTVFLDQLGHHEPAATVSGFAATPTRLARGALPEINAAVAHLRRVLGDEAYESFARQGADMTNAAMATYALDQIDRACTELQS